MCNLLHLQKRSLAPVFQRETGTHAVFGLSSFSVVDARGEERTNKPFATSDHMVQNAPSWRASSLLFPHWAIKTKRPEPVKLDLPLF